MAGGYGLAALAGLGQAFPKLAEGMISGQQLDQKQQQLDELAAFRKDQNEARYTDLGPLAKLMGWELPAGMTTRMPIAEATAATKALEGRQQRQQQKAENAGLADLVAKGAQGGVTSQPTGPTAEGEAGLLGNTPSMTTATPPDMKRLAASQYLRGLSTPAPERLMEYMFPNEKATVVAPGAHVLKGDTFLTPPSPSGGPEGDTSHVDLNTGILNRSAADSLTGKVRTTTAPASSDQLMTAHYNRVRQLEQKAATGPLSLEEQRQLAESKNAVNTLKPYQIAPGGTQVDRFTPGSTAASPNAGGVPGGIRTNPANPSGTDIKDAGDRSNIIQQLEGTANTVRKMDQLQTASGRGSLAMRAFIQGRTPFETLGPEEQAYVVTHENLRQLLIQAQMGLGPFRSPEMQAQLQNTIGRYWTPGTAERLDALAKLLRGQQSAIGAAEQAGNHRQIHTAPPTTERDAGGAAPVVKWGRDAQGRPVRLQ